MRCNWSSARKSRRSWSKWCRRSRIAARVALSFWRSCQVAEKKKIAEWFALATTRTMLPRIACGLEFASALLFFHLSFLRLALCGLSSRYSSGDVVLLSVSALSRFFFLFFFSSFRFFSLLLSSCLSLSPLLYPISVSLPGTLSLVSLSPRSLVMHAAASVPHVQSRY